MRILCVDRVSAGRHELRRVREEDQQVLVGRLAAAGLHRVRSEATGRRRLSLQRLRVLRRHRLRQELRHQPRWRSAGAAG